MELNAELCSPNLNQVVVPKPIQTATFDNVVNSPTVTTCNDI